MSPYESFKKFFSSLYSLAGVVNKSPIGFQSQIFWGFISQVQLLGTGAQIWDSIPLFLREKHGIVSSLLTVGHCTRFGEIVCQPLLPIFMWIFCRSPNAQSHSASLWVPFRGGCSICSCRFGR